IDVKLELRCALEPTLEVVVEVGADQIEPRWRGTVAAAADTTAVAVLVADREVGPGVEVVLLRHQRDDRYGWRCAGIEHAAVAGCVERYRSLTVTLDGGDQEVGPTLPSGAVGGYRQVHFEVAGGVEVAQQAGE